MRVPYSTQQNTRPSSQGLGYLEAPTPDFSSVDRGLYLFNRDLRMRANADQAQADQTDKFKAEQGFLQFETDSNDRANQIIKDAPLESKDLPDKALADYNNYESKFIAGLPPALQDEFKVRTTELRQRVNEAAINAQNTGNTQFYKDGIIDATTQAQVKTEADPNSYAANKAQLDKLI